MMPGNRYREAPFFFNFRGENMGNAGPNGIGGVAIGRLGSCQNQHRLRRLFSCLNLILRF
jgi:hypothetical protein